MQINGPNSTSLLLKAFDTKCKKALLSTYVFTSSTQQCNSLELFSNKCQDRSFVKEHSVLCRLFNNRRG